MVIVSTVGFIRRMIARSDVIQPFPYIILYNARYCEYQRRIYKYVLYVDCTANFVGDANDTTKPNYNQSPRSRSGFIVVFAYACCGYVNLCARLVLSVIELSFTHSLGRHMYSRYTYVHTFVYSLAGTSKPTKLMHSFVSDCAVCV